MIDFNLKWKKILREDILRDEDWRSEMWWVSWAPNHISMLSQVPYDIEHRYLNLLSEIKELFGEQNGKQKA